MGARLVSSVAAGLLIALAAGGPGYADDALAPGEAVAREHCARCHVIGAFNRMGGIGSTPSFSLLRKRGDWEERYTSFYARRPHPAFVRIEGIEPLTGLPPNAAPVDLSEKEVEDLMAYVRALPVQ